MKPALLALLAALALTGCSGSSSRQPASPISVDVGRTASLVSAYRAANGLGPVRVESRLNDAAESHARLMGQRDKMSHSLGGSLPKRIAAVGYDWGAAAENLGAGYANLDAAVAGWKRSAGHRRNLLNPNVTEIGVAAVAMPPGAKHRTYWALILAAPRPQQGSPGPFAMGPLR